jgi:hypothetical protein
VTVEFVVTFDGSRVFFSSFCDMFVSGNVAILSMAVALLASYDSCEMSVIFIRIPLRLTAQRLSVLFLAPAVSVVLGESNEDVFLTSS